MIKRVSRSPRAKTRGGFTLIEMSVVLSLLAVVLPLAAGTIVFLLRAQSQSAEALRDAMALTQLSHTFHADVHAARGARLSGGSKKESGIILEMADARTIEYRTLPQSEAISRVVQQGKTVERREQFRIGSARPTFEMADSGREVGLTIAPRLSNTGGASPVTASAAIRLGAIVGRDASVSTLPSKVAAPAGKSP